MPTQPDVRARAEALFKRSDIAYVHMRSARNNCYQCRIERALNILPPDDAAGRHELPHRVERDAGECGDETMSPTFS